jgi:hypothetical protein
MNATLSAPLGARVLDTFRAPRRLAERLGPYWPFAGALALVILVGMLALTRVPDSFFVEMSANPVDRLGRPVELTSDSATIGRWGRFMAMFTVLVQRPMLACGIAGVLVLVFSLREKGGSAGFRSYFALTAHALLIPAAGELIGVLVSIVRGGGVVPISLALLAPGLDQGSFLYALLDGINPFTVWMLVVLAIAASTLQRRDSWKPVSLLLVGSYAALALVVALVTT